jgi:hypothetical protein
MVMVMMKVTVIDGTGDSDGDGDGDGDGPIGPRWVVSGRIRHGPGEAGLAGRARTPWGGEEGLDISARPSAERGTR